MLEKLNETITGAFQKILARHAPRFANAAQSAIGAMPDSLEHVPQRFGAALRGAGTTVTTQRAARETGKSIAELRTAVVDEAGNDAPVTELGTAAIQLASEFSERAGQIHGTGQTEQFSLREGELKSDDDSKQKSSEIVGKLYEFNRLATRFANAWTAGELPQKMVDALLAAGNRMSELYEQYNWPLGGMIDTLGDILRVARFGPLSSYDVSENSIKFYQ